MDADFSAVELWLVANLKVLYEALKSLSFDGSLGARRSMIIEARRLKALW